MIVIVSLSEPLGASSAAQEPPCYNCGQSVTGSVGSEGVVVAGSGNDPGSSSSASSPTPSTAGAAQPQTWPEYQYRDYCGPGQAYYSLCLSTTRCKPGENPEWLWEKDSQIADWVATGQYTCVGGTPAIPRATDEQVVARSEEVWQQVPLLHDIALAFSPKDSAVVQLPLIISATPWTPVRQSVTLAFQGFPSVTLDVAATPHWHFVVGGTAYDRDDPGRPFDGRDPVDDPGYYFTVTPHRLDPLQVSVSASWTVTATRTDTGATIPLTGIPAAAIATTAVPVREARAVLTG
jgi:hypothetical protein